MERMTYDFCVGNTHCWQVKGADNSLCKDVCREQGDNGCDECPIKKAFDRLAAYEDTGLEPEEMLTGKELVEIACALDLLKKYQSFGPVDRFRELAQAEKDGRLVALPCKVGDKVYRVITTLNAAPVITEIEIKTLGQAADLIGRIGKKQLLVSWYLAREEAEAALKKREGGR